MKKNIKVLNRKLVKPSIPTPPNLKNYKLSFQDQFLPLIEVGVIVFYASRHEQIDLEESLAKVLVQFYPLSGRFIFKDDQIVDCSDQGAEFITAEAQDDVELASLIVERDLENLGGFLPRMNQQVDVSTYPILSIQITELKSGGLVIGISVSHKIFDASSMATFLAAWSNASKYPEPGEKMSAVPSFNTAVLFPGRKLQNESCSSSFNSPADIVVRRFSFNEEVIARLRSDLRPNKGKRGISMVRVVCAVIARVLIRLDRAKYGRSRDSLISMAVNMRERTLPPLHKHACGNLVLLSLARCTAAAAEREEGMAGMQELVDLISEATNKSISDCAQILSLGEDERNDMLMNPIKTAIASGLGGEASSVNFSDYSKFGFYKADFGWGEPVWASIAPHPTGKMTVLMENRQGNGIEAWVHLDHKEMPLFEQDREIRMFCNLE